MDTVDCFRESLRWRLFRGDHSQSSLAKGLGVTAGQVSDFMHSRRNFSVSRMEEIAKILSTTYIDMINEGKRLREGTVDRNISGLAPELSGMVKNGEMLETDDVLALTQTITILHKKLRAERERSLELERRLAALEGKP